MKKTLSLLLSLLMLVGALVSCGEEPKEAKANTAETAETTVSAETTAEETPAQTTEAPEPEVFEIAGVTDFIALNCALIYSSNNTGWLERQFMGKVCTQMTKLCMNNVPMKQDTVKAYEHEIVVGAAARNIVDVSDLDNDTFRVVVKDGNVYVGGKTPEARIAALWVLAEKISERIAIKKDFEGKYSDVAALMSETDYKMTWSDDFEGTALDRNKWGDRYQTTADIMIVANDTTRKVANGILYLTATNYSGGTKKYIASPFPYTADKMSFKYGYVEVRAKLNFSYGSSSAIWSVGDKVLGDTSMGVMEIDMVELLGRNNSVISNLHRWYYPTDAKHTLAHTSLKKTSTERTYSFGKTTEQLNQEYHVYGLEWTPEYMKFSVDGEVYLEVDITEEGSLDGYSNKCFQEPLCLILSQFLYTPARGFTYSLKGDEVFSYTSEFDYVKVFQTNEGTLNDYSKLNKK